MSELFNRFRSTAGKAAFEAEKLRRINAVQSTIKSLKAERDKAYHNAGRLAFHIYQEGEIDQPTLVTACEKLQALQDQINAREQEIEQIRGEEFVESALAGRTRATLICPKGHGPLLEGTKFCQECGSPGISDLPTPTVTTKSCRNCHAPLSEDAKFCANCGQPVIDLEEEQKPDLCKNCGVELFVDAAFCVECGATVASSTSEDVLAVNDAPEIISEPDIDDAISPPLTDSTILFEEEPQEEQKPELCKNCGVELLADAEFCIECGTTVYRDSSEDDQDVEDFNETTSELSSGDTISPPLVDSTDMEFEEVNEENISGTIEEPESSEHEKDLDE